MATQAEVLQKVADYCTEKQYTLNDDFRSQFSERFAKANAEASVDDEAISNSIKFSIDTAFSAASKELKLKDEVWNKEKSDYLKQIEELKKKSDGKKEEHIETIVKTELPKDLKEKLDKLEKLENERQKQEKRANVLELAKKNVREDLHGRLNGILDIMQLDDSEDEKTLAQKLNDNFDKIYKEDIANTKPLSSKNKEIKYDEMFKGLKKVKI